MRGHADGGFSAIFSLYDRVVQQPKTKHHQHKPLLGRDPFLKKLALCIAMIYLAPLPRRFRPLRKFRTFWRNGRFVSINK